MSELPEPDAPAPAYASHREVLVRLLSEMGVTASIETLQREGRLVLNACCGDDDNIVIGRRGQTLEALQYLVNRITRQHDPASEPCTVDVSGYRERRRRNLVELARRSSERVIDTGVNVIAGPFNPFERHVIHTSLKEHPRVTTESVGEGESKKIIFSLRNQDPPHPEY